MHQIFTEFSLLLIISAFAGMIALWLKQPVLIAYIVVGIVVGPAVLGLVGAHDQIDLLAQVGVAVLLFVVGLKLDLQHIRHIGPVALATGLGQLTFTIIFGFIITYAMGKSPMDAIYVAVALTFSSTIIIVKLLTDKREIDALHGRIAIGFLIVQDLAVVIAMMLMSTLKTGADAELAQVLISLAFRLAIVVVAMFVLMRYFLPKIVARMARSQELLLIFAIAWGTSFAALGEWSGFSKEAGAFLAGFSLASSIYRDAISARLTGIRDFLLLFFFIDLGSKLDFSTLGAEVAPAIVLSLFVLIGNPLIVMGIMGYMGYRKRTGFLAGLTVAQISEFSIVFVAMGISLGHVGVDVLGLTTIVGLVTIALSSYMILYSHPLYDRLSNWLSIFERKIAYNELTHENNNTTNSDPDVMVFGAGRYGSALASGLQKAGLDVLTIDFDPENYKKQQCKGLNIRYGDGTESDFIDSLPIKNTQWIVSTLPDMTTNQSLIHALKENHYHGKIAIVAREEIDMPMLNKLGATIVLYPIMNAVEFAVTTLTTEIGAEKRLKK
ncbi:MAG: cation:proton antiporter [Methylophilaceae bacterium]|nr:MAG: cation:proton antiporter [Methylophilaceae bacterium]